MYVLWHQMKNYSSLNQSTNFQLIPKFDKEGSKGRIKAMYQFGSQDVSLYNVERFHWFCKLKGKN